MAGSRYRHSRNRRGWVNMSDKSVDQLFEGLKRDLEARAAKGEPSLPDRLQEETENTETSAHSS